LPEQLQQSQQQGKGKKIKTGDQNNRIHRRRVMDNDFEYRQKKLNFTTTKIKRFLI
jgi:hypothetical protein